MKRAITGYHRDEEHDWVAELECGHDQHVRHNPPWMNRPWVTTLAGRESMLGTALECVKCERGEPADRDASGPRGDSQRIALRLLQMTTPARSLLDNNKIVIAPIDRAG